jgi:aminopeptidase N
VAIDMTAAIDGLSSFDLDLVGLDVAAVEIDGQPARFERTADEVIVELDRPVAAGTDLQVTVTYGGELAGAASRSQGFEVGWVVEPWGSYVASEPDGARNWFPADDHPTDKATFDLAVTVPRAFDVVASGRLAERTELGDGRVRWRYRASDPTATYLASVAVGDFELVDSAGPGGLPLRHALTPETVDDAGLARTSEMIDVLSQLFGPFPFETYGVLVVPEALGFALENQTLTLMGEDLMGVADLTETVLAHELAHQWAGDSVSVERWSDVWLNEGFATYGEWWWDEATGGSTVESHAAEAHGVAQRIDLGAPVDPGVDDLFDPTVYLRGALVLDALRTAVGDEVFVAIVREWVARFGGGSAGTDDFLALVDELGGPGTAAALEPWLTSDQVPPRP